MKFREVKLPSGAVLKIQPAPFADSKTLYQALLRDAKGIHLRDQADVGDLLKTFLMTAFASPDAEAALWVCFSRCIYNSGKGDLKIDKDTFEPVAAREDYTTVCMEVAEENISPFVKSLYAVWKHTLATIESVRK